jgi:hypothetical protein
MTISDIAQALASTRASFASLEQKNTELQERVNALEKYIQAPWWRRKKAPK